jgi:hypothetical protein
MNETKYYTSGISPNSHWPTYALYHPIFDCFLILVTKESIAFKLKAILSSRYPLFVTAVSTATNFQEFIYNNFNNTCCELYTIENSQTNPLINPSVSLHNGHVICPNNLILSTPKFNPEDIDKEKHWAELAAYWISTIDNYKKRNESFSDTHAELNKFLDLTNLDYREMNQTAEKEIMKLLYLGRDYDSTSKKIERIGAVFQ